MLQVRVRPPLREQINERMTEHESIMFYAFRYALGRHTYAVSDVADYLIRKKSELQPTTRSMIIREIKDHFKEWGDGGWECDKTSWDSVVNALSTTNE